VDVQVLLIDGEGRQAERDPAVVSDGHAGKAGLAAADDVEGGRAQVDDVTQPRDLRGRAVRIVREQGTPGPRPLAAKRRVVAAYLRNHGCRQQAIQALGEEWR